MPPTISVFSDVICPWCYVGKRRLERALDQLGLRGSATIEWLPFELNPDMPADGMERALYRARKFGAERSERLDAQMAELGRQEGIGFAFDRMTRTPSTRRAHMLIAAAGRHARADPVVDALFRAYFEEGRDVGDPEVLREIGLAAGSTATSSTTRSATTSCGSSSRPSRAGGRDAGRGRAVLHRRPQMGDLGRAADRAVGRGASGPARRLKAAPGRYGRSTPGDAVTPTARGAEAPVIEPPRMSISGPKSKTSGSPEFGNGTEGRCRRASP